MPSAVVRSLSSAWRAQRKDDGSSLLICFSCEDAMRRKRCRLRSRSGHIRVLRGLTVDGVPRKPLAARLSILYAHWPWNPCCVFRRCCLLVRTFASGQKTDSVGAAVAARLLRFLGLFYRAGINFSEECSFHNAYSGCGAQPGYTATPRQARPVAGRSGQTQWFAPDIYQRVRTAIAKFFCKKPASAL